MTANDRAAGPTTATGPDATSCGQGTDANSKAIGRMPVGTRLITPRTSMPSVASAPERAFSPNSRTRLVDWLLHLQAQAAASGPGRDQPATPNPRAPETQ